MARPVLSVKYRGFSGLTRKGPENCAETSREHESAINNTPATIRLRDRKRSAKLEWVWQLDMNAPFGHDVVLLYIKRLQVYNRMRTSLKYIVWRIHIPRGLLCKSFRGGVPETVLDVRMKRPAALALTQYPLPGLINAAGV